MFSTTAKKKRRVNFRTPEVMERVQTEVEDHYRSAIVEKISARGGSLTIGDTTIRLAKQFGFCYGVERAIDLAYASREVFPEHRIYLIGEIIHNPEVNRQLGEMGIASLPWEKMNDQYDELTPDDVVIVPAFGAPVEFMNKLEERECIVIDATCGDVMKVWRRVRSYAREGVTSIIHGKAGHEETRAMTSRALNENGSGHYLVILTLEDADYLCDYIRDGGNREGFLERFAGAFSDGFDPDEHLRRVGVANQTTMLKSETEEIQNRVQQAVVDRDQGRDENFQVFDTICGATQERQDALFEMLGNPMDMLLVVGGYNSSNTSQLVAIGERELPTFFIRDATCLKSLDKILHFDLEKHEEVICYSKTITEGEPAVIGITAGASCPGNLIENTVLKAFELRGITADQVEAA